MLRKTLQEGYSRTAQVLACPYNIYKKVEGTPALPQGSQEGLPSL
jgi:hypothetical protein